MLQNPSPYVSCPILQTGHFSLRKEMSSWIIDVKDLKVDEHLHACMHTNTYEDVFIPV